MILLFLESVDLPPPFMMPNLSRPPPIIKEQYALYQQESQKKITESIFLQLCKARVKKKHAYSFEKTNDIVQLKRCFQLSIGSPNSDVSVLRSLSSNVN